MKKNKIAKELTIYFSLALLAFSVIIGIVFIILFQRHTINITESQLEHRATKIATTMASYLEDSGSRSFPPPNKMNFPSYIDNLSEIAMADVWIVDKNLNIFTPHENKNERFQYNNLPKNAEKVIENAFKGTTAVSESFSSVLTANALTVGSPIITSDGETVGVVLLHSPISGTAAAIGQGILILIISIFIALALSILLSINFSITFTKPLNIMKNVALRLADGDYSIKTGIYQNDEIGDLAAILDELSIQLDESSKESEKLEQIRREYVANISHELRTPITIIRGSLEALCDGIVTDDEMVKAYHNQMLIESKGLQRLVGDLLDLSRLQNADFAIEMSSINLCDILIDIERSCKNLARDKNVDIEIKMTGSPCMVVGDYGRLRQLLMIVSHNAIKFSPINGTVKIELSQGQKYKISVSDNGIGISRDELPYIFDRFYKTKSSENVDGTGLGLAIAKEIALRHNAELTVVSEQNIKTIFTLTFNNKKLVEA